MDILFSSVVEMNVSQPNLLFILSKTQHKEWLRSPYDLYLS